MRVSISKAVCLSVVLAASLVGTRARADIIHATTHVGVPGISDTETGEFHATSQGSFSFAGATYSASATAQGMPGVSGVLVNGSSSIGNSFGVPVYTEAQWQDTLTLSGPAGSVLPDVVDLYFHTQGAMSLSGLGAQGSIGVSGTNFGSSAYDYRNGGGTDQLEGIGVWDSVHYGGGHLDGFWHMRVGVGQVWQVTYFTILSGSADAFSSINGNDPPTFSFDAVRLTDGRTPEEAGLTITFDSGITSPNVRSVPEPSSVALTLLGATAVCGWSWRRRRGQLLGEV